MELYSDSDNDGLEIGHGAGMGVRQLLIFFVLFLEKLHGKAGSLGGVGDMGPHVPHHGAVSLDLVCFYFCHYFRYV